MRVVGLDGLQWVERMQDDICGVRDCGRMSDESRNDVAEGAQEQRAFMVSVGRDGRSALAGTEAFHGVSVDD
jgi:hypothetical protein